jgi:hypothetical protein
MRGAIPPLPKFAFMAWCSFETLGQLYLYLIFGNNTKERQDAGEDRIMRSFVSFTRHQVSMG